MQKVQYFVNLQDLAASLITKELLCTCFAKTNVIRYTSFFQSSEQLLFGTTSLLLYVSLTYLHKMKTTVRQINAIMKILKVNMTKTIQKL